MIECTIAGIRREASIYILRDKLEMECPEPSNIHTLLHLLLQMLVINCDRTAWLFGVNTCEI